jgi:hypothetical protein
MVQYLVRVMSSRGDNLSVAAREDVPNLAVAHSSIAVGPSWDHLEAIPNGQDALLAAASRAEASGSGQVCILVMPAVSGG